MGSLRGALEVDDAEQLTAVEHRDRDLAADVGPGRAVVGVAQDVGRRRCVCVGRGRSADDADPDLDHVERAVVAGHPDHREPPGLVGQVGRHQRDVERGRDVLDDVLHDLGDRLRPVEAARRSAAALRAGRHGRPFVPRALGPPPLAAETAVHGVHRAAGEEGHGGRTRKSTACGSNGRMAAGCPRARRPGSCRRRAAIEGGDGEARGQRRVGEREDHERRADRRVEDRPDPTARGRAARPAARWDRSPAGPAGWREPRRERAPRERGRPIAKAMAGHHDRPAVAPRSGPRADAPVSREREHQRRASARPSGTRRWRGRPATPSDRARCPRRDRRSGWNGDAGRSPTVSTGRQVARDSRGHAPNLDRGGWRSRTHPSGTMRPRHSAAAERPHILRRRYPLCILVMHHPTR